MLHDLIVYTGWSQGETYMTFGFPMILATGLIGSAIANIWSKVWANRIAGYTLLLLIGWAIFALMLWDKPWRFA